MKNQQNMTIEEILARKECQTFDCKSIQIDPKGEIHETVLVAFGEAATFAGSILGIDYHYKSKDN